MMDPFETLGVARRFDLDLAVLEKTHRELSRALHPDRYSQAGASERRAALDKAASVNEAWQIVKDPVRRAESLFRIHGVTVGENHEPPATPSFLMEMLEEREALADARSARDLEKVRAVGAAMGARAREVEAKLAAGLDGAAAAAEVAKLVPLLGELRFYRRFLDEVSAIEEDND